MNRIALCLLSKVCERCDTVTDWSNRMDRSRGKCMDCMDRSSCMVDWCSCVVDWCNCMV